MTMELYQPGGVNLASTDWLEQIRRTRRLIAAWMACGCGTSGFELHGMHLPYFLHTYNQTWSNERCVEVALALQWLRSNNVSLLEIGNVMSHYGVVGHDVLDKYETPGPCSNLIQQDVLTFPLLGQYVNILSISTIEHVGRDEEVCDPRLAIDCLLRLEATLPLTGNALVTFAVGYNLKLDEYVREIAGTASTRWRVGFLKRIRKLTWLEANPKNTGDITYGSPYPCGNGIFVLTADAVR